MKRPLAYITAAWLGGDSENAEQAARYCRAVYEAGFSPICPPLYLPLFLNDAVQYPRSIKAASTWAVTCSAAPMCWWSAATP